MNKTIKKISILLERRRSKLKRSWEKLLFNQSMHKGTVKAHDKIIADAEMALKNKESYESNAAYLESRDPLVRQGYELKKKAELHFKNLYAGKTIERILIHVPAPDYSPAGYSLFTNLAESLVFIGIPTRILGWDDNVQEALETFKPTVLLSSDSESYLERIDWEEIAKYKETKRLKVGLTAALAEYDSTPLDGRLDWAKKHHIDFFYSYRDEVYVSERKEYKPFFEAGYKLLFLPFGANILHYYPVPGFTRDIDFVLIATRKREHIAYMKDIAQSNAGFIDGPGWKHVPNFHFSRERDRYIYARAKVGLNVHLPEQLDWACEVNERTYQLAACGVPQLIDHPKLIDKIFSKSALFVADTPEQYTSLFKDILSKPNLAQERALHAQKEVFDRHTTFHRAESFIKQLAEL
jgi:hypothetical protein